MAAKIPIGMVKGETGTVSVGKVETGAPGTMAQITQRGTKNDAIFDFIIPRGQSFVENLNGTASPLQSEFDRYNNMMPPGSGYEHTSGSNVAYVITNSKIYLGDGVLVVARMHLTCGDNATLNLNNTGAKLIKTVNGAATKAGDIAANAIIALRYSTTGNCFFLQGGSPIPISDDTTPVLNMETVTKTVTISTSSYPPCLIKKSSDVYRVNSLHGDILPSSLLTADIQQIDFCGWARVSNSSSSSSYNARNYFIARVHKNRNGWRENIMFDYLLYGVEPKFNIGSAMIRFNTKADNSVSNITTQGTTNFVLLGDRCFSVEIAGPSSSYNASITFTITYYYL